MIGACKQTRVSAQGKKEMRGRGGNGLLDSEALGREVAAALGLSVAVWLKLDDPVGVFVPVPDWVFEGVGVTVGVWVLDAVADGENVAVLEAVGDDEALTPRW